MDVQSALIGVAIFIVSAGVLLFISMFGIKEKSYEEALAEQRQQANALLGVHTRPKPKEKKVKKANKKVKEKQPVVIESETAEESEDTESPSSSMSSAPHKLHVEFKEPNVSEPPVVSEVSNKQKRGKKDKMRPILIHHKPVENPVIIDPVDVSPANHFEQLHPKDEFEMLHSHLHTKEETAAKSEKSSKSKQNGAQEQEKPHKACQNSLESKDNKTSQPNKDKNKEKSQQEPVKDKPKEKQISANPDAPPKQKKAPKQVATVPPASDKEEPAVDIVSVAPHTNGYVASTAKEKKKKKSELNALQQISGAKDGDVNLPLLLNVVRKAELSRSEVQILIDLLLNKQHEAPAIVDEWSEGKADPIQRLKKQLAEKEKALVEEQQALVGAQAKLREIRAEQTAEKSQLQQKTRGLEEALQSKHLELQTANNRIHTQNQKMQQMQTQLNEEGSAVRKLREEIAAVQLQRQQMDMHVAQAQEAEATIQDLQTRNNQLTMELHSLTEQNMATKEHQQNLIVQLQHQVNHFKGELDEKENFNQQFEELHHDLEHRLGLAQRQEGELKVELSQLQSVCQQNVEEIRRLEHGRGQALEEVRSLQKQKEELDHSVAELKAELCDVQAEKSELQVLKANGVAQENQSHKEELLNLHNELSSVKSELQYVEKKYAADLDASHISVKQLETELDEQKNKNNELRKKNWKVMDALKAAESRTSDTTKIPPINVDEIVTKVRSEEQDLNKRFIQRLFPDIQIPDDSSYEQWSANVEKVIEKYVSDSEKGKAQENQPEVAKLQAQVLHYKTIIDDTEGILKKLQNHIEQEEIHWRKELKTKEQEIEALKRQHLSELQTKVAQLELKLTAEQEGKQSATEAYELLKSRSSSHADPAVVEKLSEQVNRLSEQLYLEQRKNAELTPSSQLETNDVSVKEQNSNSTNGPSIQADSN